MAALSLYDEPGTLIRRMTNFNVFGEPAKNSLSRVGITGNVLLYILAAALIVVIIMLLRNIKIDLSWLDIRPKRMQVTSDSNLFWKPSWKYTNLLVTNAELGDIENSIYSFTFECVIYESRSYRATTGPYRHIFHRGSNELISSAPETAALTGCPVASSNASLPEQGLPSQLNPGIFLDPVKNDILIFVDTVNGSVTQRESVRISDIPLNKPFRIGIVMEGRILEVYKDCQLEITKVLSGTPKVVENKLYGVAGIAGAQAQIQNLYIWKRVLTADDLRSLCPSIVQFSVKRPVCEVASAGVASSATTSVSTPLALDYGLSLSGCPA